MDAQRRLGWPRAIGCASFVLAGVCAGPTYALDVTTCGQSVPPGNVGVLTTDLTCASAPAVTLAGTTLDMAGHSITGGGVSCDGKCTILSTGGMPGVIQGTGTAIALTTGTAAVSDVQLIGPMDGTGCAFCAASTPRRILLTNVDIGGFAQAVESANGVIGTNVQVSDCRGSPCINTVRRIRLTGFTANGSATTNGGAVLASRRVSLTDSTIIGNEAVAVSAHSVTLRESVVAGNDQGRTGVDLDSDLRPRLFNAACGLSHVRNGTGTWGVCSGD